MDESTLFEFASAVEGWRKANTPDAEPPAMNKDQLADLGIEGF